MLVCPVRSLFDNCTDFSISARADATTQSTGHAGSVNQPYDTSTLNSPLLGEQPSIEILRLPSKSTQFRPLLNEFSCNLQCAASWLNPWLLITCGLAWSGDSLCCRDLEHGGRRCRGLLLEGLPNHMDVRADVLLPWHYRCSGFMEHPSRQRTFQIEARTVPRHLRQAFCTYSINSMSAGSRE